MKGGRVLIRPAPGHPFSFIDDLGPAMRDHAIFLGAAAVIESSPNNFQAWVKHSKPLPPAVATLVAKKLAAQFDGDPSGASYRHSCTAPGFTNRKPKHQRKNGTFPWTRLKYAHPDPRIWTGQLIREAQNEVADRERRAREYKASPPRPLSDPKNCSRFSSRSTLGEIFIPPILPSLCTALRAA